MGKYKLLTSSIAESDFQVIFSTYRDFIRETGRNHLLTLETEEKTILGPIQSLESFGVYGKMLPTNEQGQLTKEILVEAIKPKVAMLSISFADHFTGVIHPIFDLAEVCREKEIKLHLNLNAVLGKLYFQLEDIDADFFTLPGAVIAKESFAPVFENVPSQSLEQILEKAKEELDHFCTETARLRDQLERGIQERAAHCQIPFQAAHRLPHISVIAFPGLSTEALLYLLHTQGIDAKQGRNHLISFELTSKTKEKEIDHWIECISDAVQKLQNYAAQLC